ncbi:MAG: adenosine deaminase [Bdellovibrionales bacterium RIFOXYD1_FULL_44_7]|nr:MAG: adenosine deaminase [Bdellovibrionales bacterium RIFOXYD1_FULL_44_7]
MEKTEKPWTELHRHLDISARTSTVLELAKKQGLEPQSSSLESFRKKLILAKPMTDLDSVLAQFKLFQQIFDTVETFERIGFEVVEDCWNEGIHKAELRFSPSFACQYNGLSWTQALEGFKKGLNKALNKYSQMQAGLICIATRDYGPDIVGRTVEFFLDNRDSFIGFDLAGTESRFSMKAFETVFQPLRDSKANITVHAGESTGPETIWQAIENLGAKRIGHGITSVQDSSLLKYLSEKQICLEICPTSNWLTQCVKTLGEHPLPRILRAGVPVSINTDDPGMFAVSLGHEINICRQQMGLSDAEIERCRLAADKASFLMKPDSRTTSSPLKNPKIA